MTSPYATGGTTILQGTYNSQAGYLHIFETTDNFSPIVNLTNITVVVVGGGGEGGTSSATAGSETSGGGGGAGGYGLNLFPFITPTIVANYLCTVGDGGTATTGAGNTTFVADIRPTPTVLMEAGAGGNGGLGTNGGNGVVATLGSYNFIGSGGGAGSQENAGTTATTGGSGGTDGGDSENNPSTFPLTGGGGGGSLASGSAFNGGGNGGAGQLNPFSAFTGQSARVGGGGGGGEALASAGNGGLGGGGNGANSTADATSGSAYGAGGGGGYGVRTLPGNGNDGVVMIFYPTPPSASPVTALSITATSWFEQTISWIPPVTFDGYDVYVTDNPSNYGTAIPVSASATSFTANTASVGFPYLPDTIYYFRVVVKVDFTPDSAPTDTNGATQDPPAPTGFTVSVNTSTSQTLVWTAPSPQPNSYNFYATTNPLDYGSPISLAGNLLTRVQTGLTPNTIYYYRIRAVYIVASTPYGSPFIGTNATTPNPPAPAGGLYYKPLQIRSPVGRGANDYPGRHPGRGLPITQTLWMSSL
jgi:hypothetical protein